MNYKLIATHDGHHHADEVLAIKVVHRFHGDLPIKRLSEIPESYLKDPSILVLDKGRKYEPKKGNFDHHQDGNLFATNVLVLDYFCQDEKFKEVLKRNFFSYIDAVGRGHIVEGKEPNFQVPSFNALIRSLNNVEDGFNKALLVADMALDAFIATAEREMADEIIWNGLGKKNGIAVSTHKQAIVGWQRLAQRDDIMLIVQPNMRQENTWKIVSRDTKILKIPEIGGEQFFCHKNGFTAAYRTYEAAYNHAAELMR